MAAPSTRGGSPGSRHKVSRHGCLEFSALACSRCSFDRVGDLRLKEINRLIEGDQTDAAVLQLKRVLERNPERADASQLLAWAYYKMHRYEEALAEINHTIKREDRTDIVPSARAFLQKKGSGTEIAPALLEARRILRNCLRRNLRIPGTFSTTSLTFLVHSATMKLQSNIIKLQPNSINDNHPSGRTQPVRIIR